MRGLQAAHQLLSVRKIWIGLEINTLLPLRASKLILVLQAASANSFVRPLVTEVKLLSRNNCCNGMLCIEYQKDIATVLPANSLIWLIELATANAEPLVLFQATIFAKKQPHNAPIMWPALLYLAGKARFSIYKAARLSFLGEVQFAFILAWQLGAKVEQSARSVLESETGWVHKREQINDVLKGDI